MLAPGSVSVLFGITHYYRRPNWQAPEQYAELKERHNKVWQINAKWSSPRNITKNPGDKNLCPLNFKPWHPFNLLLLIPDWEGLCSFKFDLKNEFTKKNKNRRSNLKHQQKDFGVRFSLKATRERKMKKVESDYYHVIYILTYIC